MHTFDLKILICWIMEILVCFLRLTGSITQYMVYTLYYLSKIRQSEFGNIPGPKDFGQGLVTTSFSWYLCVLNIIDLY